MAFSLLLIGVFTLILFICVVWNDDYAGVIPAKNLFCNKPPLVVSVIVKQLNPNIKRRLYGNAHKAAVSN
jgi:hypothetical protein